jgi:phosphoglycerate dehydrogenase-like enzyme
MRGTAVPDLPGGPVVRLCLPDRLRAAVAGRLGRALGGGVRVAAWHEGPAGGEILLVAPHELTPAGLSEVLAAADWSWVHLTSAGLDFVDLVRWPPGRLLTRSWQCYAAPIAEYVTGAIMAHEWRGGTPWDNPAGASGHGLWGAAVGIAGWGAVGQRVAEVTSALGARVRVFSRSAKPPSGRVTHTTVLDGVLDADHLVIALPLTPATVNLFSGQVLARARPGLHLVNISRAAIVDQHALARACAQGRLFATLDVTEPEPLPAAHPLRAVPGIRLSPHLAWRSRGSDGAFTGDFLAIWRALAQGAPLPGQAPATSPDRARAAVLSAARLAPPDRERV